MRLVVRTCRPPDQPVSAAGTSTLQSTWHGVCHYIAEHIRRSIQRSNPCVNHVDQDTQRSPHARHNCCPAWQSQVPRALEPLRSWKLYLPDMHYNRVFNYSLLEDSLQWPEPCLATMWDACTGGCCSVLLQSGIRRHNEHSIVRETLRESNLMQRHILLGFTPEMALPWPIARGMHTDVILRGLR